MKQAPGEPVQKVCPRCGAVANTADHHCPWCGGGYRRRLWPALVATAFVTAALTLAGTAYMLVLAGDEFDSRLDDEVQRVQDDLDTSFDDVRKDVRDELDRRLPEEQQTP
jgi:hypothetical protein